MPAIPIRAAPNFKSSYYKQLRRMHSPSPPVLHSPLPCGLLLPMAAGSSGAAACTALHWEDPDLSGFSRCRFTFRMTINSQSRICSWHCSSHVAGAMPVANLAGNVCCFFNKEKLKKKTSPARHRGAMPPWQCQLHAAWCRTASMVDRWLLPMLVRLRRDSRFSSIYFCIFR